jgi:invasion protein IalB
MAKFLSIPAMALLVSLASGLAVQAQQPAPDQNAQQASKPSPWSANCVSDGRKGELECIMQQRVVMSETGQLLAALAVRFPQNARTPELTAHVPFGISLPDGIKIEAGDKQIETLVFRACDGNGCYASKPLTDAALDTLRKNETVNVSFNNLMGREIKVPVPLLGFTEAYDKIR